MRFTLAQIEAFTRIVETGTFQAAARQLNLTQPTVSQRIRELEKAIGGELFLRNGPRIQLTPEGSALIDHARRLLAASDGLTRHFTSADSLKGVLRLGMTDTFALACLNDLVQCLAERYPGLKTAVRVDDSGTMSQMLEEAELDVAILVEANVSSRIREEVVGHNELAWMAGPSLRLPRRLRPRDLAGLHIMLPPPPSRVYTTVDEWFSAAGEVPSHLSTCNSARVILQAIMSGVAISVQATRLMADSTRRGRVKRLPVTPALPAHRVSICYQTATLGPGVEAVVALERELIEKHQLFR
jgi:DNA-binding transcriptional LysR family regulator